MKLLRALLVALFIFSTTSAFAVDSSQYLYERTAEIVGGSYIKGFWVFDATGTAITVTDRSSNSHTMDLGGAASTLSPAVEGYCPNLTMAGTAATSWSAGDDADFRFGDGAGNDSPFTLVALVNPNADDFTATRAIIGKGEAARFEYWIQFYNNGIGCICTNSNATAYVGRASTVNYTTDAGSWHTYVATFDGGSPQTNAGCNLYRDGADIDNANYTGGAYAGMVGNTGPLDCSAGIAYSKAKYGVVIIISKELTVTEVGKVNTLLQSYVGNGIPPMDLLLLEDDV